MEPSTQTDNRSFSLRYHTDPKWVEIVVADMDLFLPDHAAAERKASAMAMSMVAHYPDRPRLVKVLTDVAVEELAHFRDVIKLMQERGLQQAPDTKDHYVLQLRKSMRKPSDEYLLDRLLTAGIIEARGAERFGMIRDALPRKTEDEKKLHAFYHAITRSEERHQDIFIELALEYFNQQTIFNRLDELLKIEAEIVKKLPLNCSLH